MCFLFGVLFFLYFANVYIKRAIFFTTTTVATDTFGILKQITEIEGFPIGYILVVLLSIINGYGIKSRELKEFNYKRFFNREINFNSIN